MEELKIIEWVRDFLWVNGSVPFICLTVVIAYKSWRGQQGLARAKNSIDLQNNFLASERMHACMVHVAETARTKGQQGAQALALVSDSATDEDKETLNSLRVVLNAFERMAIGVNNKVYDECLLFESYASFVIETHDNYQTYLQMKRDGKKSYYVNFCLMAEKWEVLRAQKKKPGQRWWHGFLNRSSRNSNS